VRYWFFRRDRASGWQDDPIRVFQWLQIWNLLLQESGLPRRNRAAFLSARAGHLGVSSDTLETSAMLLALNERAEKRFRRLERKHKRDQNAGPHNRM